MAVSPVAASIGGGMATVFSSIGLRFAVGATEVATAEEVGGGGGVPRSTDCALFIPHISVIRLFAAFVSYSINSSQLIPPLLPW